MGSVLYEHFSTEHIRGHHARVGTARRSRDRALRRDLHPLRPPHRAGAVPQRLAAREQAPRRRGHAPRGIARMLRHRVLHGVVARVGGRARDPASGSAPARSRSTCSRRGRRPPARGRQLLRALGSRAAGPPRDARSTRGTPTRASRLYTLVGLSRHADHHAWSSRPYQQLRYWEESPEAAVRLLRHGRAAAGPQCALPRADDRGAAAPTAGPLHGRRAGDLSTASVHRRTAGVIAPEPPRRAAGAWTR